MLICSSCKEPWEEVGKISTRMTSTYNRTDYVCTSCGCRRKPVEQDQEIVVENIRLSKQKQRLQDINRIERKAFREYARVENAVSEYAQQILELLKVHGSTLSKVHTPLVSVTDDEHEIGIIQVTDAHLNELIDLPHNKYDMRIASERLYKLAQEAKIVFGSRGIKKVLIAFTADLLNSDRRLDEVLNQSTNRSKATFVSVDLIKKFILDVATCFEVSVASVVGNESRVNKDMSFANNVISDNFDFTIMNMVRLLIEDTGIKFSDLDKMELVVNVNGQKMLMSHDVGKYTNNQINTQATIGRFYISGQPIDFIISGHLHATKNGQLSYRSASLAGSNEFNEHALNLAGRASQNLYIIGKSYRHVIGVDLQHTVAGQWYDIDLALMAYNCKSHGKTVSKNTILEIVI